MNIAICDDEILFTRELSSLLTHWAEKNDFSLTPVSYTHLDVYKRQMLGLASAWTKASLISSFLEEFQKIILAIVSRVIIPILPYFCLLYTSRCV